MTQPMHFLYFLHKECHEDGFRREPHTQVTR